MKEFTQNHPMVFLFMVFTLISVLLQGIVGHWMDALITLVSGLFLWAVLWVTE